MERRLFHYNLPPELIAQAPLPERRASRLLVLDGATGRIEDRSFTELPRLIAPGDLVVLNDTAVLPARLVGRKPSGGRVEILVERITGPRTALALLKASHGPRPGERILLPAGAEAAVGARHGEFFDVGLDRDFEPYLRAHGQVPLPPYIERAPTPADAERYQTVFARTPGAVAAPTAGLHFDRSLLAELEAAGVDIAFVTLHVGAGTFAPVRTERIEAHVLHAERVEVTRQACDAIRACRARGGRVVAVGTTTVRALEAAALAAERDGVPEPFAGETRLFIYPGFEFRVVDALVTNFHLPESSLLMLVAAFAGREVTLAAYAHAVQQRYRFFSYGDAMLVTPQRPRRGRAV
ncbi:MAG TPA: tRNA preQ1(34) S-adenosylmethionine ribosyltransferase-isomerase QueA [Gammaproteobacteria bacterium]